MSNDNQTTSEQLEQAKLSQVYAQLSDEQPCKSTDEAILALAELQVKQRSLAPDSSPSQWRKWQWPTSIAASVIFVSVIVYTQYGQFDLKQAQPDFIPADSYAIADQATLDESAARKRAVLETKASAAQRQQTSQQQEFLRMAPELKDFKQQEVAESEISEPQKSNYAEQEAQELAAKAIQNAELDINPEEFQIDNLTKIEPRLVSNEDELMQGLEMSMQSNVQVLLDAQTNADDQIAMTEIVVTGARLQQSQTAPLQSSYLLDVADKLKRLQLLSAPDEQQRLKIASLQQDLIDYLLLQKTANPQLQIDQDYLNLLTPEQRAKVAR
ncbi:hypothetical protein [Aliiglaciecola litoralis]|uniref:Uncharacterized protein n=1 Tax=Aliiglaciecola litoralis TaxID=582857 RepID=A0ABN1LD04_9ALTE